jgi:hypothetical protein
VQRPLAVVAEDARRIAELAQRVEVADLQERTVDHLQAVGATGHEDLREHVVEVVARVLGDLDAAGERRHLHRRAKSAGPKMIVSSRSTRRADLVDVDEAARGLDLRLDADARLAAGRLLDLGEQHVERLHLGARSRPSGA